MRWLKKILARGALLLVALLITVALAEVAMRVAGFGLPAAGGDPNFDRSSTTYWPPDARQHPWLIGATNFLRVAVIGDSFSNAHSLQYDDTYGLRLERLLNQNPGVRPAGVWIYAKGGTSTYMQLPFLQEALTNRPDLVILGICLNDTEDFNRYQELKDWRIRRSPRPPPKWLAPLANRARVVNFLWRKAQDLRCTRNYHLYFASLYDPGYSGWNKFTAAIRAMRDACAAQNVKFLPVVFPMPSTLEQYRLDFAHDRIRELMAAEKIPYLDLLDTWRGKSSIRFSAVPFVDEHPSEIAHRYSAEVIFEFLLAHAYLPADYLPQGMSRTPESYWRVIKTRLKYPELAAPELQPRCVK